MKNNFKSITIDNGGSELRYTRGGDFISGTDKRKINTMEKNIRIIERELFRVKDNIEGFDILDFIQAPREEYRNMYATGVGYFMYSGVDVIMNNQNKKSDSVEWYQQALIAIATDAMKHKIESLNKDVNKNEEVPEDVKEAELQVAATSDEESTYEYIVTTLLPVLEHSGSKDNVSKLKERLQGTYTVSFPALKEDINTVTFNIEMDRIGVLPEGAVVMTALRNEVTPNDYTLIIDMGHVTTDYAIFKGTNLLGNSVVSSQFAGGTLLKLVMSAIRKNGINPTEEMALEALQTYKYRIGKKEIDITDEVNEAKKIFVNNYLKDEIYNQVELAGITVANIQNVVPLGAVLGTANPKTEKLDIVDLIIEELNLINSEVKVLDEDLRYVNISKASDFGDAFAKRW